ncbi:hypothetical protein [Micromonospora sp. DT47]|uniref:hypothetical protein n=1 Tax=Micromonospora sp. DT47 TaxID=3393431 RepID=UPI003CE86BF2
MSDHNVVPELTDAFTAFRSGGPLTVPPGARAAREVVRRRRTARVTATGLMAATLIATPVLAGVGDTDPRPPAPPTTSETPWAPPSATTGPPSASPTPSVTSTPSAPAPDGRISKEDLGNATLRLPAWPSYLADECPAGQVRFRDGRAQRSAAAELRVTIDQVVHADVDRDGAEETAALIRCSGLEMGEARVLAFDRDRGGSIRTMGVVVGETGDVAGIGGIRADGRQIAVEVVDYAGDGIPDDLAQRQWRVYSWTGRGFAQTDGPTSFPANPRITDLSISGDDLRLTSGVADSATGTLRLTVENNGPQPADALRVRVNLPKPFTVTAVPSGCTAFPFSQGTSYTCRPGALPVSASIRVDLPVSVPRSQVGSGSVGEYSALVDWGVGDGAANPEPDGARKDNDLNGALIVD